MNSYLIKIKSTQFKTIFQYHPTSSENMTSQKIKMFQILIHNYIFLNFKISNLIIKSFLIRIKEYLRIVNSLKIWMN